MRRFIAANLALLLIHSIAQSQGWGIFTVRPVVNFFFEVVLNSSTGMFPKAGLLTRQWLRASKILSLSKMTRRFVWQDVPLRHN